MLRPVFPKPFEYRAFLISPDQSLQHGRNTAVRFPFSKNGKPVNRRALTSHRRDARRVARLAALADLIRTINSK